ncbi:MAG TPA: hypothetical protein VFS43_15165 [Polyangiaceae bacterium]|nr:hypothetical protein [Polyangiaceae bacterium]
MTKAASVRAPLAALVALAFAGASVAPRTAAAQPAGPAGTEPATAEALFREGRRLLKDGKVDEACAALAESQRLDPSSGTLLNLADCHERQGKIATAWAEFVRVGQSASTRGNETRAAEAKRRAAQLEPKLSYLTVSVAPGAGALTVKRNGETVEAAQYGVPVPVDPGEQTIAAEAAGRLPFRRSVTVRAGGERVQIEVPALAPEPTRAGPAPAGPGPIGPAPVRPEAAPAPRAGGKPVLGYVAGGVGVAALGVGAVFGLRAVSTYQDAKDACPPPHQDCSEGAIDDRKQAGRDAWVANIGIGVGVVALAAGAYLLFVAPSKPAGPAAAGRPGLRVAPGPGGGGFLLRF